MEYDLAGNMRRQTTSITTSHPLGFTTFYTYNVRYPGKHWLEDMRGPDGVQTSYDYDSRGQRCERTNHYPL